MITQSLVTALVIAFSATAIFGHLLLVRAAFTPAKARNSATADAQASHHAPVTRARIPT